MSPNATPRLRVALVIAGRGPHRRSACGRSRRRDRRSTTSSTSSVSGRPAISPDGQQVAYTIRETNWDENAYETEIWIGDAATGQSRQLTNARKSSSQPAWSPDGAWLGFVSDRDGKRQIYRIALARRRSRAPDERRRRRQHLRVVAGRQARSRSR